MLLVVMMMVVVVMLVMSMRDNNYSDVSLALQGTQRHFFKRFSGPKQFEHPTVTSRCQLP